MREYNKLTTQQLQNHIGSELRDYRIKANIVSAEDVSRELGLGINSLYLNEQGKHLPTKKTLIQLFDMYGMKHQDREKMLRLRELVLEKRKEEKESK